MVAFILARPAGRPVHLGLLGSFGRALGVVGFIRSRHGESSGSFGFVGFMHVVGWLIRIHCPGGRRVHSVSLMRGWRSSGSFARALGVGRFILVS